MCINSVYVTVIITVLVQSAHTVPALTMPIITDQPITLHHLLHFNCNLPWHAQAVCIAVGTQPSRQRSAIITQYKAPQGRVAATTAGSACCISMERDE
ncbi:hypothetical protein PR003_g27886 [Phytophthora rubi]|uniref:Secreted protein n=1 Tax=Phytophthora rubi TaxID=129364 RepID=A0A6A3HRW7_9STRA|nr:hypothetical protein PR002_g27114 [Phytophthora rubi]KAE8996610.1 hypothetical protein PR001_g19808 [Phytophthora rubi]KAE9280698.1 hypothetical protein PR003_g27886 [Phytophthora rubi]